MAIKKHDITSEAYNNMTDAEKKEHSNLAIAVRDARDALNDYRKKLNESRIDLNFWYKQQQITKARIGITNPISLKIIHEKSEYYKPAKDYWSHDTLPSEAILNYAMQLYYKELIKYGEKVHKKLKQEMLKAERTLNASTKSFQNFNERMNELHKSILYPLKVKINYDIAREKSIRYELTDARDIKPTTGFVDVNPNNKHLIRIQDIFGYDKLLEKLCFDDICEYPEEKIAELKYDNYLEYRKLFQEMGGINWN